MLSRSLHSRTHTPRLKPLCKSIKPMTSFSFSAAQADSLNRILADAVSSKTAGAVFFGVTTADGPIYMHTAGTKLPDEPESGTIDEDAVFWLCSQTKLITTLAALQLVEQGKIALDTPVDTVLPELADPVVVGGCDDVGRPTTATPAQRKITFGQLLNHSSGLDYSLDETPLPAYTLARAYSHSYENEDVSVFFNILKGSFSGVPLNFEPGTNYAYGWGLDCAGFVVQRLSGKSLERYFQDHIFSPLGITSASFYLTPPLKDRLLPLAQRNASGIVEKWKGPSVFPQDPANVRVNLGGVGLYASQKDYLAVLRHLLQIKGGRAASPLLSRASVDSMFTPSLTPAGATTLFLQRADPHLGLPSGAAQHGHGLFVNTADVPGKRRSGSGAWGGWASTSFFVDPTTGVAAVFGMQVAPTGDTTHTKQLLSVLEREVYSALSA
ncbi:beta-lactamase/transpeptidase-like protein [Mycena leptocephala]|nr:beta-lactamase/transpeptidase-like protein [Mycena leptocephala]